MKKKRYTVECGDCGKNIVGFSQHHLNENKKIHNSSNEHQRIKAFVEQKLEEKSLDHKVAIKS